MKKIYACCLVLLIVLLGFISKNDVEASYYPTSILNEEISQVLKPERDLAPKPIESNPTIESSCDPGAQFCFEDGGDGGYIYEQFISVSVYGSNSYMQTLQPMSIWSFKFTPTKTEYYKIGGYSFPNSLQMSVTRSNGTTVVSGMTNNSYLASGTNTEFLLSANQQYTVKIINNNNLTDFSLFIYRDDNSTLKNPTTITSVSEITRSMEYTGDSDYYKFQSSTNFLRLFSTSLASTTMDLASTLYICSSSSCANKSVFETSDNMMTEVGTIYSGMSSIDFGYDLDTRGLSTAYFLLMVTNNTQTTIGEYTVYKQGYLQRDLAIDSSNWVSEDMYPTESQFSLFTSLGVLNGFDQTTKIGYYKYSYYAIGDNTNIYTIYFDWLIETFQRDINTFNFGFKYLHADLYKYNPITNTLLWVGHASPSAGDIIDVNLTYASNAIITYLTLNDNLD